MSPLACVAGTQTQSMMSDRNESGLHVLSVSQHRLHQSRQPAVELTGESRCVAVAETFRGNAEQIE